jgi:hypothetical protein
MKRDMDLIRELLLWIEEPPDGADTASDLENAVAATGRDPTECSYNITLLLDAGFIIGQPSVGYDFYIERMTWQGHEFLDTVRDPEVWKKTKSGAQQIGSWTVSLLVDLAKGFAKQEAKRRLGLDL